ncbi:LIM and calponin homology domains-containing protein 1-like isoform X7 [Hypanus sabinus]|uniref:LIM and calponin homology domains-containing protein 1-like isoform X7 n=1 Tax=Hypanus sabinus TaxID=79690 RepID=UPI0028C455A6|nr:LIM and calponin homology domains-containing protein 1-like isoform X7 [Hypanus sabinus]
MASPSVRDGEWGETPQQDSGPGPAFTEAQHWIEQVTGRSFGDKDFRTGLENGILLCELLNAIKPGAVKKINRLPTPIAGLDNITLFLRACEELGLKGSQLFDPGDLQDMTNRATVKVPEYSRKMKNVLITIYWLGKAANSCTSYSGPTLNLKEFEGLLSQIQKEMEDTDSPKRSIRDSGYIDSWDSERSDSLSPPRHARDDSFDSLESFGSRSQQTPSPDVVFRGSSDGRGSDSESDVTQKTPDVKRDDMSVRRSSYNEPKISLPFNQYLPNKHNHTAYMPAPLRKKQAERAENYRKSWSNTTSPVGSERPFSHPEPIEEEHSEESSQGEDFAEPSSTVTKTQVINDSKPAEKSELAPAEDAGGLENQLQACPVADTEHRTSKEGARWEGKDEEEMKKLKRIQKAGITVMPASERYRRYSPTVALSDDTGSVSMNDMRPEDDNLAQPHSKARHEELHKVHSRLREDQDRWQDDLARWKNRRRSASQDLIKRKEERDVVEKIMSGERNLSERRRSIKTYKEIVEEKESREKALQEAYNKAKTREEAEEILRKYSQRFIISEAVLENLEIPKFLERSQSVDSDSSCSPTRESNSLKYLRQQSLPIQKYTATVEAVITPSSQSQSNFSGVGTSPTKTVASKTVPMLTPKPYSQPKDSQTVLKSFKKDGKIRINGESSPTFTRVEESASPFLTPSQMFEGVARVDNTPLQLQTESDSPVSQSEQLVPSATNNLQSAQAEQMELTEISVDVATTQQPSIENEFDLKSTCSDPEKKSVEDAIPEEDHHEDLQTSPEPVALSGNAELDLRDTLDSKIITTDEACLTLKNEASDNSTQEQLDQEGLKSVTPQLDKTGDVLDSEQRITEVKEEAAENSQPVDIIIQQGNPSESNMTCFHTCSLGSELVDEAIVGFADSTTEPSNSASVPVSVRNSWRRSEFFSQPVEVESNENSNERYRREHEKLRQEWEKAQKEVEEEERRYHEEERKIIQETVTPLTPQSLPIHLPSEWLSISKTEEIRNSNSTEVTDEGIKQSDPQKQNMVEIDSCQKGEEGGILAREHQSHKETTQRSTQEQEEVQSSKNGNGYEENCDKPGTNKLEKLHWQDMKQQESKEIGMNFQSEPHVFQTDEENASERQIQAHSQTHLTDHQQVSAQAAGSPVFSDRPQNAQELPLFLDLQRNKLPDGQSEMKAGSLDRSWAHQSNIVDRKNRSGSHEDLQSSQSFPQPHSSPQLQSPSRSVSGKKLCSTCGLPLGKGAAMIIETLSLYFHIQCFTCGICQGQLGDASTGTDVRIRNGLLNCNDCYIRSRTAGQPTTL